MKERNARKNIIYALILIVIIIILVVIIIFNINNNSEIQNKMNVVENQINEKEPEDTLKDENPITTEEVQEEGGAID